MEDSLYLVINDHLDWTSKTFADATSMGALFHAKRELDEVELAMNRHEGTARVMEEFADVLGCLFDSAARYGITPGELAQALEMKLRINRQRKWRKNGDGSYSHIKE